MKKAIYLLMAGFCLCMTAAKAESLDVKKTVGEWTVTVPGAPYDYRNFEVTVKVKDKQYLIDVAGDASLKDQKFEVKDDKLTGNVYVGEYVKVTIWEEKGQVKGKAETSVGSLPIEFKRKVKESSKK